MPSPCFLRMGIGVDRGVCILAGSHGDLGSTNAPAPWLTTTRYPYLQSQRIGPCSMCKLREKRRAFPGADLFSSALPADPLELKSPKARPLGNISGLCIAIILSVWMPGKDTDDSMAGA